MESESGKILRKFLDELFKKYLSKDIKLKINVCN